VAATSHPAFLVVLGPTMTANVKAKQLAATDAISAQAFVLSMASATRLVMLWKGTRALYVLPTPKPNHTSMKREKLSLARL